MDISDIDQQKKKEYDAMKKFLDDNHIVIDAGYKPMRNFRTEFLLNHTYFTENFNGATVNTKPLTAQKTSDKHSMANIFGPLAETGFAFAGETADVTLKGQMNWTKASIFSSTDANAASICQNIYADLKALLPNTLLEMDYLVTLLVLNADLVYKTDFENSATTADNAIIAKSVCLHNISDTAIPKMEEILVSMDKVVSHMSQDFQDKFKLLYTVDTSSGVRHDHLLGKVFDSVTSIGIPDVQIKLVEHPEHVTTTDLLFDYELSSFPNGTWQFEVSKVGYHTITITLTVGKGKTVHHDFMLVPV
ncbi:MAG: hypothetical protein WCL14_08320 [Bacteroidota bacterium]